MRSFPHKGGSKLAIGIDWQQFASQKLAAEKIKALPNPDAILSCGAKVGDGYVLGIMPSGGNKKAFAAAMAISKVHPSIIIYKKLDDGLVWVCGIDKGQPLAGMDLIIKSAEADAALSHMASYVKNPVIAGDHLDASVTLADVLNLVDAKAINGSAMKLGGSHSSFNFFMAALLLVATAAVITASYIIVKNSTIELASDSGEAQRQSLVAAISAEQANELFKTPMPHQQYFAWAGVLATIPVASNGWEPTEAHCTVLDCTVTWRRQPFGLPSSAAHLPGTVSSTTPDVATTQYPIGAVMPFDSLPTEGLAVYLIDSGALIKELSVGPAISDYAATLPPSLADLPPPIIARTGSINISAPSVAMAGLIVEKINQPGVRLNSMTFNGLSAGSGNISAAIEGVYFDKK